MIATTQSGRAKLLQWLKRAAVLCGGLYLTLALFLATQVYFRQSDSDRAALRLDDVEREILKSQSEISRGRAVPGREVPSDLGVVAKLQSALEKRAANEQCDLVEFRASSDVAPYLTRFAKTTSATGWGQVQAQATLSGSPKSVLAALAALPNDNVPYEFDSLEIRRDKVNPVGDALVLARVTLRVLIRMERQT